MKYHLINVVLAALVVWLLKSRGCCDNPEPLACCGVWVRAGGTGEVQAGSERRGPCVGAAARPLPLHLLPRPA